jgi:hypothetical protein
MRFLVLLPLAAASIWAQQTTATLYAVLSDPTGATIPGATVTITHTETGAVTTRATNEAGEAIFDFLRVGSYSVKIEAKGFKRAESKGIELSAAQNVRQTFTLEEGN